jgi:hypothetical protein
VTSGEIKGVNIFKDLKQRWPGKSSLFANPTEPYRFQLTQHPWNQENPLSSPAGNQPLVKQSILAESSVALSSCQELGSFCCPIRTVQISSTCQAL